MPRARVAIMVALGVFVLAALPAGASPTLHRTNLAATGRLAVENDVAWRTIGDERLLLDVYLPLGNGDARAAVVLVHGGAWQGGDKAELADQGRQLAVAGFVAVSIEYRFALEHPWPAQLDDVRAAVVWLRADEQVRGLGIDPNRIGVLGGSAGGQLAAMLGVAGRGDLDTGSRVAAVVSWSGPMDLVAIESTKFDADLFGCAGLSCIDVAADASPVTHVDASDPPVLLVNAWEDPITKVSQTAEMASALDDAGVRHDVLVVPGSAHSIQLAPDAWAATLAFFSHFLRR